MKNILFTVCWICLLLHSCEQNSTNSATKKNDNIENSQKNELIIDKKDTPSSVGNNIKSSDKINNKIIFNIPPPSGPGTGVCQVTLKIENNKIEAIQTCGGHDENGRTESSSQLFKVNFMQNHKYKISKLFDTSQGSAFGGEFFEIKDNQLYLYDENLNIINEWFCTHGNIPKNMRDKETCDCIFLPSEN